MLEGSVRGKIGRAGPRLTQLQEQRLAYLRNAMEHSDEKLLGRQKFTSSPQAASGTQRSTVPSQQDHAD